MEFGAIFPQIEVAGSPAAVRDYAVRAEALGYDYILAYDHILGANPDRAGGWRGPYTYQDPFLEPFVLFSYMAAVTERIGLATGIIILPQRQTALVAKQAATLDRLSGGRLRLGVGLGWNEVEYQALGQDFHRRGKRIEHQVPLLRALWTSELITWDDPAHHIPDAGINPLPIQQPIPIWFGGSADPALRRMARHGDGWIMTIRDPEAARPKLALIADALRAEGRDRAAFGIEAAIDYGDGDPTRWRGRLREWQALGVTKVAVNTMRSNLTWPAGHLDAIARFLDAVRDI